MKKLLAYLLMVATCYGVDYQVKLSDLNNAEWVEVAPGDYRILWSDIGGVTPSLWTDTNNPAILHYLQELQPSNYVADASGNDYFGEAQGTFPTIYWNSGTEGYFFRGDTYIQETNTPQAIGATSEITVNCWHYPTVSGGGGEGVMYMGNFANDIGELWLLHAGNDLYIRLNSSTTEGNGQLRVANIIPLNEWRMLTARYNGAGITLYTNGVLAGTNNYSTALDFSGLKYIVGSGYNAGYSCNGWVTEPRVYERALTDAEILTLFNNGRTNAIADAISTANLVSYYPMTNDALQAHDYAGNSVNLDPAVSFANAPTFRQPVLTNDNGVLYAVDFDGTDDSLENIAGGSIASVDAITDIGTNEITLCVWFKIRSRKAFYALAGRSVLNGVTDGFGLWAGDSSGTNYLQAEIADGATSTIIPSDEQVTTNEWHFAAYRRTKQIGGNTNLVELYYDGTWQANTAFEEYDVDSATSSEWILGDRSDGGTPLNGWLSEVRFYLRALTDSEVESVYQNTGTNNNEVRFTLP